MATPADLKDPAFRDAMEGAEKLLDEGDYTAASRTLAEAYISVLDRRPDLLPGATAGPHTPTALSRAMTWPPNGGITVQLDGGKPHLHYAKERFGMSEAYSYFEFMMGLLWNLQDQEK